MYGTRYIISVLIIVMSFTIGARYWNPCNKLCGQNRDSYPLKWSKKKKKNSKLFETRN